MEGSGPFRSPTVHTRPTANLSPSPLTQCLSPSWPPASSSARVSILTQRGGLKDKAGLRHPAHPPVPLPQCGGLVLDDPEAHSAWPGRPPVPSATHNRHSCVPAAATSDPAKPCRATSARPPSLLCWSLSGMPAQLPSRRGVSALLLWHQNVASFWVICTLCLPSPGSHWAWLPERPGP